MIHSDWHIHSEYSYDSTLTLDTLIEKSTAQGLVKIGVTDHVNTNEKKFLDDLKASAKGVSEAKKLHPYITLGVELTPIDVHMFGYLKNHDTLDGYVAPSSDVPFGIELAVSKEELMAEGVRYCIGASHWRIDQAGAKDASPEVDSCIREWYRQQLWMACDERVTILGHPWYHGLGLWYEDFDIIPRSMKADIAAALKENGKYVECNSHFFWTEKATEKFRHKYAEYLREMFEMGIPVTYGSDAHNNYGDARKNVGKYLSAAGFKDGDISELAEKDLW